MSAFLWDLLVCAFARFLGSGLAFLFPQAGEKDVLCQTSCEHILDMAHAGWLPCCAIQDGMEALLQQAAWQNTRQLWECWTYRPVPHGLVVDILLGSVLMCQFFVGFVGLCVCLFPWKWDRLLVLLGCRKGSELTSELPTRICWKRHSASEPDSFAGLTSDFHLQ